MSEALHISGPLERALIAELTNALIEETEASFGPAKKLATILTEALVNYLVDNGLALREGDPPPGPGERVTDPHLIDGFVEGVKESVTPFLDGGPLHGRRLDRPSSRFDVV